MTPPPASHGPEPKPEPSTSGIGNRAGIQADNVINASVRHDSFGEELKKEPVLQALMDIFKGEVLR